MRKIQFSANGNDLPGWENTNFPQVDITKRLPYTDCSIDRIFAEHVIEHITLLEAAAFFWECKRILVVGGGVRFCVPDSLKIYNGFTPEYGQFLVNAKWALAPTREEALRVIVQHHGHKTVWTGETFRKNLALVFEEANLVPCYTSTDEHFNGIDSHWKFMGPRGKELNELETVVVEAWKR